MGCCCEATSWWRIQRSPSSGECIWGCGRLEGVLAQQISIWKRWHPSLVAKPVCKLGFESPKKKLESLHRCYLETALLVAVICEDQTSAIKGRAKEHRLLKRLGLCGVDCKVGCTKNQRLMRATHFFHLCKELPGSILVVDSNLDSLTFTQVLYFALTQAEHWRTTWRTRHWNLFARWASSSKNAEEIPHLSGTQIYCTGASHCQKTTSLMAPFLT